MKRLTIFTPTYNRAYILPKLYESLCFQTCKDFEWLVVDDGSMDNTRELVDDWIHEGIIDVRYCYQENGGKMRAHNRAVIEAQGELFMCVDSDDCLNSGSVVGDLLVFWQRQKNEMGDAFQEIGGLIGHKQLEKPVIKFPENVGPVHFSELAGLGFKGETALCFRRDILLRYPFPSFEGEKFVTDVYVYDLIDRESRFLLFPYIVQKCRYHEDGYTHNYIKLLYDNPQGHRAYHNQCVKFKKKGYLKNVICYVALSLRIGGKRMFADAANRPLTILLFSFGVLKYLYDNYRLSKIKS